jgi:hypothetical protein
MKVQTMLNHFDLFSYPVYGFNVEGHQKIGSCIGLVCTTMVSLVMISYSLIQVNRLVEGRNPLIANSEVTG